MSKIEFGERLRQRRTEIGLTQAQLAQRLSVSQQTVARWEKGWVPRQDSVLGAAALFGDAPEEWLPLAGYEVRESSAMARVPARPLADRLPLQELTSTGFERLTHMLAVALYPSPAVVHRVGGPGHAQQGADITAENTLEGRVIIQCKRAARFGPGEVAEAARAAADLEADRRVLVLSRVASPAARDRARQLGWDIWDHDDMVRMLQQDLPTEAARRIVDVFFPGYREHFLGLRGAGPWSTAAEFFAGRLEQDDPFSHALELVGRDQELHDLSRWASSGGSGFHVLIGSAGVGKTRLVLELARTVGDSQDVYFAEPNIDVRPEDFERLGARPTLIVIDDAHERQDVEVIVRGAALRGATTPTRILLVSRPYGESLLERALAEVCHGREWPTRRLSPLASSDARALAASLLGGSEHSQLVERVVALTGDCTLLTVAAAHLLKTKRIDPALLSSEEGFRTRVLDAWYDEYASAIRGLPKALDVREVLQLLAAVQPLDLSDAEALEACGAVLGGVPRDRLVSALDRIATSGLVVRRGTRLRIHPDMLADHILVEACFSTALGRSSGFADRVWQGVSPGLRRSLVVNLARIDWKLSSSGATRETLMGLAWQALESDFREGGVQDRVSLLEFVKDVAYYQPGPSLGLARWAVEHEIEGEESGFFGQPLTYDDVRAAIPAVLQSCALHLDYLEESCDLLWALAKDDPSPTGPNPSHPLRALAELARYSLLKPFEYSERVVDRALAWLRDEGRVEAFEILDEALKWDAEDHFVVGYTIRMRSYSSLCVDETRVLALRSRVVDAVLHALASRDSRLSARAVHSLANALRRPGGLFGRKADDHENDIWVSEATGVLGSLCEEVELRGLDAMTRAELLEDVERLAESSAEPVATSAQRVMSSLAEDLDSQVAEALMHGPWSFRRLRRRGESATRDSEERWLQGVIEGLLKRESDALGAVRVIEERLKVARDASGQVPAVPGPLVAELVRQEPAAARVIAERVLEDLDSVLMGVVGYALSALRRGDGLGALRLAQALLETGRGDAKLQVAYAYGWGLGSAPRVSEDEIRLIRALVADDDVFVSRSAAGGLRHLAAGDPAMAIEILLETRIGRSPDLADDTLVLFAKNEPLSIDLLDETALSRLLDELAQCPRIDEYWVGEFLGKLGERHLDRVIDLLKDRVERAESEDSGRDEYRPLPFGWDDKTPLSSEGHPNRGALLEELRTWASADVAGWRRHYEGPRLFAAVAGEFDDEVLAVLESGLDRPLSEAKRTAHLLSEAPKGIIWSKVPWVSQLLEKALRRDADLYRVVGSALHSAIVSGIRSGIPGQPFPQDIEQRDKARQVADGLPPGSAAERFYRGLQRSAEESMRREDDEGWVAG